MAVFTKRICGATSARLLLLPAGRASIFESSQSKIKNGVTFPKCDTEKWGRIPKVLHVKCVKTENPTVTIASRLSAGFVVGNFGRLAAMPVTARQLAGKFALAGGDGDEVDHSYLRKL